MSTGIMITSDMIDFIFSREHVPFRDANKARSICEMRCEGYTYDQIASYFGLTKTRIRQYLLAAIRFYKRIHTPIAARGGFIYD